MEQKAEAPADLWPAGGRLRGARQQLPGGPWRPEHPAAYSPPSQTNSAQNKTTPVRHHKQWGKHACGQSKAIQQPLRAVSPPLRHRDPTTHAESTVKREERHVCGGGRRGSPGQASFSSFFPFHCNHVLPPGKLLAEPGVPVRGLESVATWSPGDHGGVGYNTVPQSLSRVRL